MSTDNHTALTAAPKMAANAATFNTPLGQLDAKMGNVSTLTLDGTSIVSGIGTAAPTTTAQTLVGAINELDAQIGAAAGTSGSVGTSIDTDGTLKAGAVDVAAVLADAVVTGAKLALTALSIPNLHPDPFNMTLTPGTSYGGRVRHKNPARLSLIDPDAANPFGTPTLRMVHDGITNLAGWRVWVDEVGIESDGTATISFAALVNAASGNYYLAMRPYDVANNPTSAQLTNSGTLTLSGTATWFTCTALAVAATTEYIDIYLVRAAGVVDADIYAAILTRGAFIGTVPAPSVAAPAVTADVLTARGSLATLTARLAVSINADGTLVGVSGWGTNALSFGRQYLQDFGAQISKILGADTTSQCVIAWIGDSYINNASYYINTAKALLQAAYGDAGAGYCSAAAPNTAISGITRSIAGTWDTTSDQTAGARGVDIIHAVSTDIASPASVAWTSDVDSFVLHYMKEITGGTFRYRVDAGGWTAVDTAALAESYETITVAGLGGTSHTLTVEVTGAGTVGVTLCGCDCQLLGNGVRLHKIGNSGAKSDQLVAVDATLWEAGMLALAPNLVLVTIGTNDNNADSPTPTECATNIETLATRVRAVLPLCDVLVCIPPDSSVAGVTFEATDYADSQRTLCVNNSYTGFDAFRLMGSYANQNTRGLRTDATHPNADGGRLIVRAMFDELLRL